MRVKAGLYILMALSLTVIYQNCSDVSFNSDEADNSGFSDEASEETDVDGGHFDLDTARKVYADGAGETEHHVHEYDDKFNTNVANFFNLQSSEFDNITELIAPDEAFYIRVANGDLSPRVALEINGKGNPVTVLQHGPFSLSGMSGTTKLTSLRAIVDREAILDKGIVSTQTNCVRSNMFSADGRYRNGALVIQAVPASKINLVDQALGVASVNEALLWESSLFWHEDGGKCR